MNDDLLGEAMKAAELGWSYMNMANVLFSMYSALKEVGFDKEEALTLTIALVHEMMVNPLAIPKKEEADNGEDKSDT